MPTPPIRTFSLEGTFTLADVQNLLSQVEALPNTKEAVLEAAGYTRYDYSAGREFDAARTFQGKIAISVTELSHPGIKPKPLEPTEDD